MKTVLITGADGFIGSHLVKKLNKSKDIKLKVLSKTKNALFNINLLQKNIAGCDVVVHLAGKTNSNDKELFKKSFNFNNLQFILFQTNSSFCSNL